MASLNGVGSRTQPSPIGVWLQARLPSNWLIHQYHGAGSAIEAVDTSNSAEMNKRLIIMKNLLAKEVGSIYCIYTQ